MARAKPQHPSLNELDLDAALDRDAYEKQKRDLQLRLLRMQARLRDERCLPLVIVFEGVDAAGKGGAIRRLTGRLDPRGYRVHPIAAPDEIERRHHYLWRFYQRMPARGEVAIFDRSWYGRVLVERVEKFCTKAEWQRAFDEIAAFEQTHTASGAVLVKFWLQVSKKEQLKRFRAREEDPFKEYKITDDDWRNRDKWKQYAVAANEMFARTHTAMAPWTLVASDDKLFARIRVLETVVQRLEAALPPLKRKTDPAPRK